MFYRVKFATQEMGWSGDIPLKECRKENVPWLVKGNFYILNCYDIQYVNIVCHNNFLACVLLLLLMQQCDLPAQRK